MLAAELLSAFDQLEKEGSESFLGAVSETDLEAARVVYLGAKKGQLRILQKQIPEVEKELKPEDFNFIGDWSSHYYSWKNANFFPLFSPRSGIFEDQQI